MCEGSLAWQQASSGLFGSDGPKSVPSRSPDIDPIGSARYLRLHEHIVPSVFGHPSLGAAVTHPSTFPTLPPLVGYLLPCLLLPVSLLSVLDKQEVFGPAVQTASRKGRRVLPRQQTQYLFRQLHALPIPTLFSFLFSPPPPHPPHPTIIISIITLSFTRPFLEALRAIAVFILAPINYTRTTTVF